MRATPIIAGLCACLMAAPAGAEPIKWRIDPEHTTIAFLVEHIGYARLLGQFTEMSGTFTYDPEARELGQVTVSIDAASVWTDNERRDEHVRDDDFLNVDEHPEITFTAEGSEVTGEDSGTVTGDLTILGTTRPVTLDVTLNKDAAYPFGHEKRTLGISARGTVVRSEYGMTYAVENGLVGDEVDLLIEFEAIRAE